MASVQRNGSHTSRHDVQSIIQGLAPENFDENSKLTSAFLSKFTCADVFLLIEAYGWSDAPGKGINVWASFAQRNPQHSETEWATIWTFWLFLNEEFKQWENRDQWRNNVPKNLLGRFSPVDMDLLILGARAARKTKTPLNWSSFALENPQHTEAEWKEFVNSFLLPVMKYITKWPSRPNSDPADPDIDPETGLPFTRRAQKFGPSVHYLFNDGNQTMRRSGLTPTEPMPGSRVQTSLEHEQEMEFVRYQEEYVGRGLSLRDLELAELLPGNLPSSVKPPSLTNPIIPLLDKDCWKVKYPKTKNDVMPDGQRRWNPVSKRTDVWEVMLPALQLASRFLTECHLETWWDDIAGIPKNLIRMPGEALEGQPQYYFKRNNPSDRGDRKKIDWLFLAEHVKFSLISNDGIVACCNYAGEKTKWDAEAWLATDDPADRHCLVQFDPDFVIPLMEKDENKKLNEAERLYQNFFFAATIVHEIAHAYNQIYCKGGPSKGSYYIEPFYEGDDFRELGWSMENTVFGGVTFGMLKDPREEKLKNPADTGTDGLPALGVMLERPVPFTNKLRRLDPGSAGYEPEEEDQQVDQGAWDISVIPLHFVEDIQQESFWEIHARAYGGEMLKNRSMLSVRNDKRAVPDRRKIYNTDYIQLVRRFLDIPPVPDWRMERNENPMAQSFVRYKLERERSIAMKLAFDLNERARHDLIRKRKTTIQENAQVERYKRLRKEEEREYVDSRLESFMYQQDDEVQEAEYDDDYEFA